MASTTNPSEFDSSRAYIRRKFDGTPWVSHADFLSINCII